MIQRIYIIIFSLLFFFSFSQKKRKKAVDLLDDYHSHQHGEVNKDFKPIPLQKRISRFPFNKAAKIKIISYNLDFSGKNNYVPPPPTPKTKSDSSDLKGYYESFKKSPEPVELRELIEKEYHEGIKESKTLTITEISELTAILYDTCNKYYIDFTSKSGCFFPRNAILFYDENDKVFAYFEICFECSEIESSPKGMLEPIETCEFLYPYLEKFFKNKGLTTDYLQKKQHEK
ncbi:hypothetical protein MP477_03980 [Chryseobacterium sp. WG23]|uniref:hypothetical protein n=1 Tax=Chryseobacterium sp. WG23 TaxID=2926910 RepID=UPI00211DD9F7|nr:hypothetical protein [Chryseobacterium sp. WG23]MCQ9634111.1 hypothetical protein [Chryseobacterium sp. WG23]